MKSPVVSWNQVWEIHSWSLESRANCLSVARDMAYRKKKWRSLAFHICGWKIHFFCYNFHENFEHLTWHNGFQVLAAIRYYATGNFSVIGDTLRISKASISRSVMSVSRCLANIAPERITFPTSTVEINVRVYWWHFNRGNFRKFP